MKRPAAIAGFLVAKVMLVTKVMLDYVSLVFVINIFLSIVIKYAYYLIIKQPLNTFIFIHPFRILYFL